MRRNTGCAGILLAAAVLSCAPTRKPDVSSSVAQLSAATGSMAASRANLTLTRLSDGRVLAVGGQSSGSTELYDPVAGIWSASGSLHVPRLSHSAVLLPSGRVLISGGSTYTSAFNLPDEIYDPGTGTFALSGTDEVPHQIIVRLSDGRVLEASGGSVSSRVFDETTGLYSPAASSSLSHGAGAYALLSDGSVLVAGGYDGAGYLNEVEVYQPGTNTWTSVSGMHAQRQFASATLLSDGRVLVAGGYGYDGPAATELASAEIYNPTSNAWTIFALSDGRSEGLLGRTTGGSVYFLGGFDSSGATTWVELIDPSIPASNHTAPLVYPRAAAALAELGGGQFLLAGGAINGTVSATAEVYSQCSVTTTCTGAGAGCGWVPDNCGGLLDCGGCGAGQACSSNQCVCSPTTCAAHGANCGTVSDGCGGTLSCGTCGAGLACAPSNVCVVPGSAGYDHTRKVPACSLIGAFCDSGTLLDGRGNMESNAPNTIASSCADGTSGLYHYNESLDRLKVSTTDGSNLNVGKTVRIDATVWAYMAYYLDALDLYYSASADSPSWTLITTLSPTGAGANTLSATYVLPPGSIQAVRGVFRYAGFAAPCTTGSYDDHDDIVFAVDSVPDTTPPSTAITSPVSGATVAGTTGVSATATDNYAVARVELHDGANLVATSTTAPYSFSWNTYAVGNGAHTLTTVAYDPAGNAGTSAAVQVTVNNDLTPPSTTVTSPASGAWLTGVVTVSATASDNVAVSTVLFYDGTTYLGSSNSAPYSVLWNTTSASNGSHTLTTKAFDTSGNFAVSVGVTVTLSNDKTPPTTWLTSPASGANLTGVVTLTAGASDNTAVTRVEFYDGAALLGTSTVGPTYSVTWNTPVAANGVHSLSTKAYDSAGNVGTSAMVSVTVSNGGSSGAAAYDASFKAPRCAAATASCDSATLLNGRAGLGPEANAPNTLGSSCADGTSGSYHSDESLDRLTVSTLDGTSLAQGKTARISATVWAYAGYTSDYLDLYYTANASSPSWTWIATLSPTTAGANTLSTTYVLPPGATQAIRGVFRYYGSATACTTGSYDDHDDLVFAVQ